MISFISYFFASLKQHLVGMIIIFFLVACTVGAIALKHSPVMFQAEARINIPENSRNMEKQAEKERLEKTSSNVPEQQMLTLQTAIEILQGNVLAERVIQTIGQKNIFSCFSSS
ncbi:MAG: Wzz/FepE/Etk N-terminal domain-containing protein [Candidatus Electrothrix gigas]